MNNALAGFSCKVHNRLKDDVAFQVTQVVRDDAAVRKRQQGLYLWSSEAEGDNLTLTKQTAEGVRVGTEKQQVHDLLHFMHYWRRTEVIKFWQKKLKSLECSSTCAFVSL